MVGDLVKPEWLSAWSDLEIPCWDLAEAGYSVTSEVEEALAHPVYLHRVENLRAERLAELEVDAVDL